MRMLEYSERVQVALKRANEAWSNRKGHAHICIVNDFSDGGAHTYIVLAVAYTIVNVFVEIFIVFVPFFFFLMRYIRQ